MPNHNETPLRTKVKRKPQKPNELIRMVRTSGELCQITITGYLPTTVPCRAGTVITGLSPTARFRLLKAIARIDWTSIHEGAFITLTYPDENAGLAYSRQTSQRHQMMREIEKDAGKKIPMLWRKEYKPRKTGIHIGIMVPHFHIAILGAHATTPQEVNRYWTRIIGASQHVQTDVKPLQDGKHAAMYMAKYLTKEDAASPILDYPAYLNNTGRGWGWHRKDMLPMAPMKEIAYLTDTEYTHLIAYARTVTGRTHPTSCEGITVIGSAVKLIEEEISRMALDKDCGVL